jgi:hypothetical protein
MHFSRRWRELNFPQIHAETNPAQIHEESEKKESRAVNLHGS